MANIVVTYGVPPEGFSMLKGHTVHIPPLMTSYPREMLLRLMQDADAVVACKGLDRELIEAAPKLRLIVCYGAGYDAIDMQTATQRGVWVANTPDCVTAPTAELAIAHLLALARQIPSLDRQMRGEPLESLFVLGKDMGVSLEGATLGIVGMGRIGGKVADFGRVMGMRVLYTARSPKPEREALGERFVPLAELMAHSDFISLHCPHTKQTHGLISREMLALMKPTAYLINTSRGPVVDEEALLDALRERRIAGAGLDVYCDEPHINPAFLALDNALLTPHVGSNTIQARRRMAEEASKRILDGLAGRAPQNLLNPQAR